MSLTSTAYASRILMKVGMVGVIGSMFLYWGVVMGVKAWQIAHPPYTPPNMRFKILPAMVFPNKEFEPKKFTLELADDAFPEFSDQMRVYFISRPKSVILALEEDKMIASNFGFKNEPVEIRSGVYEFKNPALSQTLTMNVLEGVFSIKYPYENDQMLLDTGAVPSKEQAMSIAKSYLSKAKKMPTDLEMGDKKISFWKIDASGLKLVNAQSEANLVRVDFFRTKFEDKYKMLSTEADRATVSILVSGSTVSEKKVVEVNYRYADVDRELFGTYPIKTADDAWKELASGKYWPVNDVGPESLTIRKVSLAYFEPVSLTNFLEPIYVFEGDNNFVAYVPAIIDKWVSQ